MTAPTRPPKQEQELARAEIDEVAPGVLRMQLPISLPGLGHVNCYALEDERGVAVVDPGLPGPEAWTALLGRLQAAGFPLRRVHTVVVTHSHPDHYGGARQLRHESGAEIIAHHSFHNWWSPGLEDEADSDGLDDTAPPGQTDEGNAGASEPVRSGRPSHPVRSADDEGDRPVIRAPWRSPNEGFGPRRADLEMLRPPEPTVRLEEAQHATLAGREWVAVHTPGHTPDHLCLYDPTHGVMLSGDHVLPTITPHISGVGAGADPLKGFFASLQRMHEFPDVSVVLPAHGHPFQDLAGRADEIAEHHRRRLARLQAAVEAEGPATVEELSHHLFPERSWGPMAESETYAHLEHLRLEGEISRGHRGETLTYSASR